MCSRLGTPTREHLPNPVVNTANFHAPTAHDLTHLYKHAIAAENHPSIHETDHYAPAPVNVPSHALKYRPDMIPASLRVSRFSQIRFASTLQDPQSVFILLILTSLTETPTFGSHSSRSGGAALGDARDTNDKQPPHAYLDRNRDAH